MFGSDFVNIYECVSSALRCCKPLSQQYTLLSPQSANYLYELENVQRDFLNKPVSNVVMRQYKATVKPIIRAILPDLQKLLDDEFELQMLNGYQSVKIGVAYFNEALKKLEEM